MPILIQPTTKRLRLRQWCEADKSACAAMNADPRVMAFFPTPLTRSESDAAVARSRTQIEKYGWGWWALELNENGKFLGFAGIKPVPDDLPFAPAVEIGWCLAHPHWGKGYAIEAARASLAVAFERLQLAEVVFFTALPNLRSQHLMERLGIQRDTLVFAHPQVPAESPLSRHCLYRLAAKDSCKAVAAK
ncbi:GNAT family N-acetyltransferase [uncultured Microbulbifer sp.]|uniref:GNAT family N-acetyltransferase n=1 Tax=uncultured Microbulbifer sp. TaxID=348147 RepID=UPI00262238F2|nr:GNAT family N-acetyltransferase [uncultured Microbulbifer sp.]